MKQDMAREIIQRLPSLYPLQTVEEEAILKLLVPKDLKLYYESPRDSDEDNEYCCPNCGNELAHGNFCSECGQPLTYKWQ